MPNYMDIFQSSETSHFAISGQTGSVAAGAATKLIFYCRNASASIVAMIRRLEIEGVIATTAFAAGQVLYQANIARAFTAENGTPGGTALTITGPNQRLGSAMASIGMGVVRISSTAALAAPTWTLDANPIGSLNSHSSAGVDAATPIIGNQYVPNNGILFDADIQKGESPILLHQNEGLAIQVTVPATGVWIASVKMKWAETARFAA